MIQIRKLREWTPKGQTQPRKFDKILDPAVNASSVSELFNNLDVYLSKVHPEERWNLYYTSHPCETDKRKWAGPQDILPFDIDGIDLDKIPLYAPAVLQALGLPPRGVAIVYSGNGIQVIIQLTQPITEESYFDSQRAHYKACCKRIDEALSKAGLPGFADPAVFSPARLLRLPGTENRKAGKASRQASFIEHRLSPVAFSLTKASGLPEVAEAEQVPRKELKNFKVDTAAVEDGCEFLKHAKAHPEQLSEPEWFAMLSLVGRLDNGREKAHEYSKGHPSYNASETDSKLEQALSSSGPRTCSNINSIWGKCATCPNFEKVKSPIVISNRVGGFEVWATQELLDETEGNLVRQEKSLFKYNGTHWRELTITELDSFKAGLMARYGAQNPKFKAREVDSLFKTFFRAVPSVPDGVNLFDPHPFCVNFENGTLHARQVKTGSGFTYNLEFLPHAREDYLNTVLPYAYEEDQSETNQPFLDMLERVFKDDADKAEKIRALRQMYGACLIPAFPHLFFLWGQPGSGKSTLILLASKLVSEANTCSVDPTAFHGFNMESMIGKLVNIETDVETQKHISDAQVKRIIDRRKQRIRRKGIADVYGVLPAVHVFGGNKIPPTMEGGVGAHDRRWTFIHLGHSQIAGGSGSYQKEYHHWIFEQSPRGVLNFALAGLRDLLESNGHYLNPASGKAKMQTWQTSGDSLITFLDEVKSGEVLDESTLLTIEINARIKRSRLYALYTAWCDASGFKRDALKKPDFFEALSQKGFTKVKSSGEWMIEGVGVSEGRGAGY